MADYYSILKKTIASLPESNGAARRSVYSRARNAIVSQLKAYEPPLSPSEITAEQLRLEEAIRKVEAEAARESLGLGPTAPSVAPPQTAKPAPKEEPAPTAPPKEEKAPESKPELEAPEPAPSTGPLTETVAAAEKLGAASHSAVQSTKEAVASTEGETAPQRQEPQFAAADEATSGAEVFADHAPAPGVTEPAVETPSPAADGSKDKAPKVAGGKKTAKKPRIGRAEGRISDIFKRSEGKFSATSLALVGVLILIVLGIAGIVYSQRDMVSEIVAGGPAATDEKPADGKPEETKTAEVAPTSSVVETDDKSGKNTDRLLDENGEPAAAPDARTVTTTTITPGVVEQTTAPDSDSTTVTTTPVTPADPAPTEPAPVTPAPDESSEPTVAAVDPPTETPAPAPEQTIAVAQRSILYEEGTGSGGAGTASQGEVVWSVNEETALDGAKETILTAAIRIPERDVTVDLKIKPNDDASLPASHLVEIKYGLPENFSSGDVQNVPGLVMKPTEEARGDALLGASVKVSPGYFWIALSSISSEKERNMGLLRERGWIDIPMLYDNGKRGILTLEKGSAGEQAVEQAVRAWQAG